MVFTVPPSNNLIRIGVTLRSDGLVESVHENSILNDTIFPGNMILEINGKDIHQAQNNPKHLMEEIGNAEYNLKIHRAWLSHKLIDSLERNEWCLSFWCSTYPVFNFTWPNGIVNELSLDGVYDSLCAAAKKNTAATEINVYLTNLQATTSTRPLWTALSHLPKLDSLSINFNGWDRGWEGLWTLLECLGPKIRNLELNKLPAEQVFERLDQSWALSPEIQNVRILGWSRRRKETLPTNTIQNLLQIRSLCSLKVTDFVFERGSINEVIGGLGQSCITSLDIQKCILPLGGTSRILDWAIAKKRSLSSLILSWNFERDRNRHWEHPCQGEFQQILSLLRDNTALHCLIVDGLDETSVDVEEGTALFNLLRSNTVLTSCELNPNFVTQGVWFFVALAELLESNHTLTHLTITGESDKEWTVTIPTSVRERLYKALEINFSLINMVFLYIMSHELRMEFEVVLDLNRMGRRPWDVDQVKERAEFQIKIKDNLSSSFYYLRSDPQLILSLGASSEE